MPGDKKHHTDKFRRCVEQVVEKGHAESAAYAICTTSMQNAGEEVFETLGGKGSGNFGHGGRPGEVGGSSSGGGEGSSEPAKGQGKLYAEREGNRKFLGNTTAEGAKLQADNDKTWPEGSEVIFVDSAGKEWLYTDEWISSDDESDSEDDGGVSSYNRAFDVLKNEPTWMVDNWILNKLHTGKESSVKKWSNEKLKSEFNKYKDKIKNKNLEDGAGEERSLHILGSIGTVRKETLNDRSYLVVPIIALMEGVIHAVNAETPEYVSGDVLKRAAASWIGKPVTLGHPAKGGKQCSASDFEVRKASGIGVIMKSEFDGRRLAQEAWIDEEKAKALHPRMYETLANGGTEEVSVGAHVVTNSVGSSFNGKLYKGSWLEASGDHLAFLPGGRGACSCEMGCGTFRAASHVLTEDGIVPVVAESFVTLEGKSLDERISMVQQAVDKWNARNSQPVVTPSNYAYAKQVFDDRVIIDVGGKIFSVPYTVSGDEVKFDGEPTAVRQAWVALSANPVEDAPKVAEKEDRVKFQGGKYVVYSKTGNSILAAHITRDAAEQHQQAIDKILGA